MANWPNTIPQTFRKGGFSESPANVLVRTQMDQGPDKVRRWGTAGIRPVKGSMVMTTTQVGYLDTFYETTTLNGSAKFTWKNPRTLSTAEMRFTAPPVYTHLGGSIWEVSLEMEILP